jgi:endonuclease V-like protein UPF0215 family
MAPKSGSRAVGIAASDATERSQLCGAVVRADRVVDEVVFATCTTGGSDATAACCTLLDSLDRPDVQWILVAGVAPAWFNIVDLAALADHADRPVIAVSFEDSDGLETPLREQFDGEELARRLERYRRLPGRKRLSVGDDDVFVRAVGIADDEAAEVVTAFTPDGSGRPEPLRVARLIARAGRQQFLTENEKTEH